MEKYKNEKETLEKKFKFDYEDKNESKNLMRDRVNIYSDLKNHIIYCAINYH